MGGGSFGARRDYPCGCARVVRPCRLRSACSMKLQVALGRPFRRGLNRQPAALPALSLLLLHPPAVSWLGVRIRLHTPKRARTIHAFDRTCCLRRLIGEKLPAIL